VQPRIELLDSANDGIDVNFAGQAVVVIALLDVFFHLLMFHFAFNLVPHPFQPIFLEIGLHLLHFFLQFPVLGLQGLHLFILFVCVFSEPFQKSIFIFEFLQLLRFLLNKSLSTLISYLWFLQVFSTTCSLAAIEVSRSLSDWGIGGPFCLGGSFANESSFF